MIVLFLQHAIPKPSSGGGRNDNWFCSAISRPLIVASSPLSGCCVGYFLSQSMSQRMFSHVMLPFTPLTP